MIDRKKIAIGAVFTECDLPGGSPITLNWFECYELCRGEEILSIGVGVVGGMLDVLWAGGISPHPLLFASTCLGGTLTASCYAKLQSELAGSPPLGLARSGFLLPFHGAAATDAIGDLEGDLI